MAIQWREFEVYKVSLTPAERGALEHHQVGVPIKDVSKLLGVSKGRVGYLLQGVARAFYSAQYAADDHMICVFRLWAASRGFGRYLLSDEAWMRGRRIHTRLPDLSVRLENCLHRLGVEVLSDLSKFTEKEVLKTKNLGAKSAVELREVMAREGITFKSAESAGEGDARLQPQ